MKYFLDTEFIEGPQKERFPISLFRKETPNTIDLISIGIVAEDGREYYAISKDFNLKEAWNRFQIKEEGNFGDPDNKPSYKKEYWLRENVLYPIFWHLYQKSYPAKSENEYSGLNNFIWHKERKGTGMKEFEKLLQEYGKTNKEIAQEIIKFTSFPHWIIKEDSRRTKVNPEFYAYYADYDWVVFCWLFGKMIDLPKEFPMYCRDLKQMMDERPCFVIDIDALPKKDIDQILTNFKNTGGSYVETKKIDIKNHKEFPKQDPSKSHNAIEDARWNKQLYEFLTQL